MQLQVLSLPLTSSGVASAATRPIFKRAPSSACPETLEACQMCSYVNSEYPEIAARMEFVSPSQAALHRMEHAFCAHAPLKSGQTTWATL